MHGDWVPVLEPAFAKALCAVLAPSREVLLAGRGTGKSCAADALVRYMEDHAPELARRVAGRLRLSEGHVTDNELCAMARDFYNSRHDEEAAQAAQAQQGAPAAD